METPNSYSDSLKTGTQEHWFLDHAGHAVFDLTQSIERYTKYFGFSLELREVVSEHKVEAAFLTLANTSIELLQPLDGNTVLSRFLSTRGEGLHHLCFRVPDLKDELARLQALGIVLIDPVPRPGARGTEIAFLHPKSTGGALIELCSLK